MAHRLAAVLLLFAVSAARAHGPANLDFEGDAVGRAPASWFVPGPAASTGWSALVRRNVAGRAGQCVSLARRGERGGGAANAAFGNLMQQFDATPFRGKRVVLSAHIRVRPDGPPGSGGAQMWFRVDRANGETGFFDNMNDRPATEAAWTVHKIVADVDDDASGIALGFMAFGATVWIDDVAFEVVGDARAAGEAPRPLTERGLANLIALARLYGYLRYFHPSDEAAACDWVLWLRGALASVENAADAEQLAAALSAASLPVAPAAVVRACPIDGGCAPPRESDEGGHAVESTAWFHYGVGTMANHGVYQSKRLTWAVAADPPEHVPPIGTCIEREIAPGVWCRVPLALYRDAAGTLPRAVVSMQPHDDATIVRGSGNDRATRLIGVIIAWNVFQHFYPYFDVVRTDWEAVLPDALSEAAEDRDAADFHETLEKLVAKLEDGHGFVGFSGAGRWGAVPLAWSFVGDRLIVTNAGGEAGIARGDEVLAIDGRSVAELAKAAAARVSAATPQHRRFRIASELARGEIGQRVTLRFRRPDGAEHEREAVCAPMNTRPVEPRPERICELRPGVWYVDLDRVTDDDIRASMDNLAAARGLVFDLRGYPGRLGTIVLAHLADRPLRSAFWCVPFVPRPDREQMAFANGGWPVPPVPPRWTRNAAFVIDGRAISYAETYMGIVEAFQLADIVGEATAGTNGNVNSFTLPGGYSIGFTGMKVRKHDGSEHHGTGIVPNVPVARTIEGIAAGRDELLDAAADLVAGRIRGE
ncbi:MAG: hypothetical protein KF699_01010 [Phycisphaeraceae bacterium]|nr:hypothetical protein [Phycisphaeraceae bacterium]